MRKSGYTGIVEPSLKIRFEMTREDFLAFNLYHHQHSPTFRRIVLRLRFGLLAMAVASAVPPCFDRQFWPMWAGAVGPLG